MKSGICWNQVILVLYLLGLAVWCSGQVDIDAASMEEGEQEALYSAIQGFVGNWWNGSDLYPDPCGWTPIQGVSCDIFDGLWYVTDLSIGHIHDNSLDCAPNAQFRPQLFQLKHLKSLSFFSCFMSPLKHSFTIPTQNWEKLAASLEKLEFRSNPGLVGQVPTSFGSLINLQSLVLLENGLTGELPTNFGKLTNLKRLVFAGNWFTGRIPDSFGNLTQLLIMDLSRNSLSGSLPFSFGGLTSLLKLDLSNNQIQGNLPVEIGYLKNLTIFDVRNNSLSGGLTKSIQEMCSLEELALSNNPIGGDLHSTDWKQLQNLAILDLCNMGLSGEIPFSISKLKKLRFLGLNDNNLTGNLSGKLATLPCLSALYINGNNLSGQLEFSEGFYRKMGRRFGAWNNPNLCIPVGLVSRSHGVRPCQEQVTLLQPNSDSKLYSGKFNQSSNFIGSLGFSIYGIDELRWVLVVQIFMMLLNF
ncbi:piriformospora indica-insensitive protein 2-like [Euphorbia lathyris]|uniref:piriformospora indica-insensitive protein 2-like n=1 Tax=Euphorbia lathyris TaxID=212925 RepID=UPI0033134C26